MEIASDRACLSEVEEAVEEASLAPVEVFVAVSKDIKNGKRTLLWALENPAKDCTGVVIAHVHCPEQWIPMMLGAKVHHSMVDPKMLQAYRRKALAEAHEKLDKYVLVCRRQKVSCKKIITENDDVARGLEELIALHGITKLVVGTRYAMKTKSMLSKTALKLAEVGASSCKIWFTCNGHLIRTREANTTIPAIPAPPAVTVASKSSATSIDIDRRTSVRSQNSWQRVSRNDDAVSISGSALPQQMQEPETENFSSPSHELEQNKPEESTKRRRAGRDKFSLHKDDDSTYPFIRSEKEYMALEAQERRVQSVKDGAGVCCANLKEELELVKQTVDGVVAEVGKMKMLHVNIMPAVKPEVDSKNMPAMKPEVVKKNMQIVLDSSFLAAIFVGFVGVFIGVVVAGMWK